MSLDLDKLKKAKVVLQKIGQGVNPLDGEPIAGESFLQDPRIIRCLFFVTEVLDLVVDGTLQMKSDGRPFAITAEERDRIRLPEGEIGITQFTKCVNEALGPMSRKLTGIEMNKHLRALGLLVEVLESDGKKRTTATPNAANYGIRAERRDYNGAEYEKVIYDGTGQRFLLENLERILQDDVAVLG